jgi:hypothetical protein
MQSRFQSPNIYTAVVIYDRPAGLTRLRLCSGPLAWAAYQEWGIRNMTALSPKFPLISL